MSGVHAALDRQNVGLAYDRLIAHRRILLVAHVVLGFIAGVLYLCTQDLGHIAYWARGASLALMLRASGAMLPYFVSAIYSRQHVTFRRVGFYSFLVSLFVGAVAGSWCMLEVAMGTYSRGDIFIVIVLQFLGFSWAAYKLLGANSTVS